MAVKTIYFSHRAGSTTAPPAYFLADTFAELSGLGVEGDLAYAKDTDFLYVFTSAWDSIIASLASAALLASGNVFSSTDNEFQEILKVDKGLQFPATQVPSADANALDDYEKGSFTPTLGATGGQSGQTYTSQFGRYQKVGNRCYFQINLTWSAKGTLTGNVCIKGLPFVAAAQTARSTLHFGYFTGFATAYASVQGYIPASGTDIVLTTVAAGGAGGIGFLAQANMGAAQDLLVSGHYETDN